MVKTIVKFVENYLTRLGLIMYFSKPDPPPAPDYRGAAVAQGQANIDAARATAKLSNPSFINPLGKRTVDFRPEDEVLITDTLTPLGQTRLDQEQRIGTQLGSIAEQGLTEVGKTLGGPFDLGQVSDITTQPTVAGRDAISNAILAREQPLLDAERQAMQTDLLVRGHNPGGIAFEGAMDQLDRKENDLRLASILAAGGEQSRLYGMQAGERGRGIQEQAFLRQLPLSEVNALRTGNQPMLPQFQGYQGSNIAPPNILGATGMQHQGAMNTYNQQMANAQNNMNALFTLGGTIAGAPPGSFANPCWVARAVYGESNPKWLIFREWLFTLAPKWLFKFYIRFGERFASFIKDKPKIKNIIRHYMDKACLVILKEEKNGNL